MANAVLIGSLTFESKVAAKTFFRELRDRYPDGSMIGGEEARYLCDLLACHPESESKIGPGIAYFSVATDEEFRRTRHFVVHRTDGTFSDFSFPACIDGRNPRKDRLEALRRAIDDQIIAFRERCFAQNSALICPLQGVPITRAAYHVDHAPPALFATLAEAWLRERELAWIDVQITPPADNQIVAQMTDPIQRASWTEFHRARAKLRMLSPKGNLSDARRQRGNERN